MRAIHTAIFFALLAVALPGCGEDPASDPPTQTKVVPPIPRGAIAWLDPADSSTWRLEKKPFLLFLVSRRSYWSWEMATSSLAGEDVAREINDVTHPVWVDADLRPDLLDRYGMGGLPSLAFLTEDLKWITGSTFRGREDVTALLRRIRILTDIPERLDDLERERERLLRRRPIVGAPFSKRGDLTDVREQLRSRVADADVSLRSGEAQVFLLEAGQEEERETWRSTVFADDRFGASGLLAAALLSKEGSIRDETVSLGTNAGAIYALALSGDEASLESARALYKAAEQLYDASSGLYRLGAADFTLDDSTGAALPEMSDEMLFDARTPTAENALMVSALCALDSTPELQRAEAVLDRLLTERVASGTVSRTVDSSTRQLLDAAHIARACLDVAERTATKDYIDRAREIVVKTIEDLPATGQETGPWEPLQLVGADNEFGSALGVFAQCLFRLARVDGNDNLAKRAEALCRSAIDRDAERLWRLGAVGRALNIAVER